MNDGLRGYTVRDCPNRPEVRQLMREARGMQFYRPRGRGVPPGKAWKDVAFGTPLRVAPKFTAYYGRAPYTRFAYVGITEDGRPRVRLLNG